MQSGTYQIYSKDDLMVLFVLIMLILLILLSVALYNYFTAPVFKPVKELKSAVPLLSVLIPARNEEDNIGTVIQSLIKQDYKNIEVIIGNDSSSDSTSSIINEYSDRYDYIREIEIPSLPDGWSGKNYVLHNLEKASKGELLLFIDADVIIKEGAIKAAVSYLNISGADILSVFPRQLMYTQAEKLIVPLLNLFLLSLLPLVQVYRSGRVSFSAGIGQFIMFRRNAYNKIGGHESVKDRVVEDVVLIHSAKRKGLKVLTMLDGGLVSCRMYNGFRNAFNGFRKNFYKGTSLNKIAFITLLSLYCFTLIIPFILVFFNILYIIPVILILTMRLLISAKSGQDISIILLHPLQILFMYMIGINSAFAETTEWKGRRV
jgi:glycosyltransferase involved in cell wall biosynthesis